jgi:hypothetical protein
MSNEYRLSSAPEAYAVRRRGETVSTIVQTTLFALAFGFAAALVLGIIR